MKLTTPRTDAEKYVVHSAANYGMGDEYADHVVSVEFAMALELENAALHEQLQKLTRVCKECSGSGEYETGIGMMTCTSC